MARYREKVLNMPQSITLLVFAFLIAFAPWALGDQELTWREGYLAVQALGIKFTPLAVVTVHGEAIPNAFPLFPMLAKLAILLGCPPELSTRLLSLFAVLGLSILVFAVSSRVRKSVPAGACAAAVMFSCLLMLDKTPDGFAHSMSVLVLFGGHLLWYYYVAVAGNWTRAWLAGLTFCAVGFLLCGIPALIFFIVPLIFMRRPLGIFRRRYGLSLLPGLAVLFMAMLIWYLPYQTGIRVAEIFPRTVFFDSKDYLKHLLVFPWNMLSRLIPWLVLAWAPFCVDFQTLDKTPLFSRFLRTLLLADFFLLWLVPMDDVYWWVILIPPLAILTGMYYEITIRRYGNYLRKFADFTALWLLPGAIVILLGFFLLPEEWLTGFITFDKSIEFRRNLGEIIFGISAAFTLLLLAFTLRSSETRPPLWCYLLLLNIAPLLVYHAIVSPYQAQEQPRRQQAEILEQTLIQDNAPAQCKIYKYQLNTLYTESIYLKRPVEKLHSMQELPGAETPVVYLLTENYPADNTRAWRSMLPTGMVSRSQKFNLWRGEWQNTQPQTPAAEPLLKGLEPISDLKAGGKL